MASECSGRSAGARGKQVHSDLKADTHAVSQRTQRRIALTTDRLDRHPSGMDEQDNPRPARAGSSITIHPHAREEVGVVDHDAIFIHEKFGLEAAPIEVLE